MQARYGWGTVRAGGGVSDSCQTCVRCVSRCDEWMPAERDPAGDGMPVRLPEFLAAGLPTVATPIGARVGGREGDCWRRWGVFVERGRRLYLFIKPWYKHPICHTLTDANAYRSAVTAREANPE